jgi:hypothetical protein
VGYAFVYKEIAWPWSASIDFVYDDAIPVCLLNRDESRIIKMISYIIMMLLEFVECCGNCAYYKRDWRGELTDIHEFVLERLLLGIVLLLCIIAVDCELT